MIHCLTSSASFFITYDQNDEGLVAQKAVYDILIKQHEDSLDKVSAHFRDIVENLIQQESYFLSGNKTKNVDISAVLKKVPIHWVAREIVCSSSSTFQSDDRLTRKLHFRLASP